MTKFITIILIWVGGLTWAQESVDSMIDRLNQLDTASDRIALCKSIAEQLQEQDWARALVYWELAEKEALEANRPGQELAVIYMSMGDFYFDKDLLDIAVEYYLEAYNLYKETNNRSDMALLENNMAISYAQLNNKQKALGYFRSVYDYQAAVSDSLRMAQVLNNIGALYMDMVPDSSLYYFKQSLSISEYLDNEELFGYNYTNLGRTYIETGSMELARDYFNQARKVADSSTQAGLQLFIYSHLAQFQLADQQVDSALWYGSKALDLGRDNLFSFDNQDVTKLLADSYLQKEDYRQAMYYTQLNGQIGDSLNVGEKAMNLERLKLKQEYELKEQTRQLLEEQKMLQYTIIGLALALGIIVLLLILLHYRNKVRSAKLEKELLMSRQKELKQDLESKNKVLIGKAMAEMHRTDIVGGILVQLKQIKRSGVKKETQHALDTILRSLERELNSNIWQEFELSFEQVHESFYKALQREHPDLTSKDRRLCSLLYLDLTSKEIAQLTGQSFKSVENARTRLRKKLALTHDKLSLSNYLNSLQ